MGPFLKFGGSHSLPVQKEATEVFGLSVWFNESLYPK
jgi:hypothetical protein